jgi:protoporphyrinogen oxidase
MENVLQKQLLDPESAKERPGDRVLAERSTSTLPHVVVLGAGPAGVGAAYRLRRLGRARVTVLEARSAVGGNAGSFNIDGVFCDFGSHRLHPVVTPDILCDLRALLGEDLLFRLRHGRILLRGRWIHFPLKPVDLLRRLPKSFALGVLADQCRKIIQRAPTVEPTFASVLERGLGRTMAHEFYFPYARKLWGLPPEELAVTTAQRRVSGSSFAKILRKVAGQLPGLRKPTAGRFYYPRGGYGRISQCLHEAAEKAGADFLFNAPVRGIDRTGQRVTAVRYERDGREHLLPADMVWSTVPINLLVRGMRPEAPADVLEAASALRFRGMILIYLVLRTDRFSPVDAYYFPEESIPITRVSEPKNFTGATEPHGRTVLCAELPSDPGRPEWDLDDGELAVRLRKWLEQAGLPIAAPVEKVVVHRLRQAYPVYARGYDKHFARLDEWLGSLDGLLTLGRQGLFAHDNTHHTLAMAYAAVDCLSPDGTFDRSKWAAHRLEFETHVVED